MHIPTPTSQVSLFPSIFQAHSQYMLWISTAIMAKSTCKALSDLTKYCGQLGSEAFAQLQTCALEIAALQLSATVFIRVVKGVYQTKPGFLSRPDERDQAYTYLSAWPRWVTRSSIPPSRGNSSVPAASCICCPKLYWFVQTPKLPD